MLNDTSNSQTRKVIYSGTEEWEGGLATEVIATRKTVGDNAR